MVVSDDGEFVAWHAISPPDKKVTKVFPRNEALGTKVAINELNRFAIRDAKAPVHLTGFGGVASCTLGRPELSGKNHLTVTLVWSR